MAGSIEVNSASPPELKGSNGKKSSRPSWSCTECTRRKIKCTKIVPCEPCCKRGKRDTCQLSAQDSKMQASREQYSLPTGPPRLATSTEYDAMRQSIIGIRTQLFHLEGLVQHFVPQEELGADQRPPLFAFVKPQPESQSEPLGGETSRGRPMASLKTKVNAVASGSGSAAGSRTPSSMGRNLSRVREQDGGDSDGEDSDLEAAVTLEFLALGRARKEDHFSQGNLRRPEEVEDVLSTSPTSTSLAGGWPLASLPPEHPSPYSNSHNYLHVFPDRAQSDAIARYSLERVGWQHGAVHAGSFDAECEEFFSWGDRRGEMVNQCWLALYAAILCVGVKHMSPQDRRDIGILIDDPLQLPKLYFDASIDALHRGNFLGKHSIYAVQAIVVLVGCCQDVGGSDLIATLLACGIRIAQHLNIHRFSSDAEWEARRKKHNLEPSSPEGIKSLIDREIRKRLWCSLATEDWVSIPYRRSYFIFPQHCSTPLPMNCHDEDLATGILIARPLEEPTIATKLILSIRIASCIRRFFDAVNFSSSASYDLCLQIDQEIREVLRTSPSYLHAETSISHLPSFVASMRNYWIMSTAHKLLVLHRTFLGRSFRDPRYIYSRKAAIEAARTILHRFSLGSELPQHVWTAIYHAISASTILCLDIFQSSVSDPSDEVANKRLEVQAALSQLQSMAHMSPIAQRGAHSIDTLLAEEAKCRRATTGDSSAVTAGKKRKVASASTDNGRFGEVAKRVVLDKTFLSTSPPSSQCLGTQQGPMSSGYEGVDLFSDLSYHAPRLNLGSPGTGSEGSLTQEGYETILFNGLGPDLYAASGSDTNGESGLMESNVDFWRILDASFDVDTGFTPQATPWA